MKMDIIEKIKNLIDLSNDNPDDNEGQTALLMAQKLMLKHDISLTEVQSLEEKPAEAIGENVAYTASKLFWWERELGIILANNFRCKSLISRSRYTNSTLIFFGKEADAELASKVYQAANMFIRYRLKRLPEKGKDYKNSYLSGFLNALAERFKQQVEEFGLMVLPSEEVETALAEHIPNLKKSNPKRPDNKFSFAGYFHGMDEGTNATIMPDQILGEAD